MQWVWVWNNSPADARAMNMLGMGLGAISEMFFSRDLGTWLGRDGQFRNQSWGGNQHTGGKFKFARTVATPFRYGSNALGWYNIGNSIVDGFQGEISPQVAVGDVVFGGAAIYSGFLGAWANLWYNLGKEFGPMGLYLRSQERGRQQQSVIIKRY